MAGLTRGCGGGKPGNCGGIKLRECGYGFTGSGGGSWYGTSVG